MDGPTNASWSNNAGFFDVRVDYETQCSLTGSTDNLVFPSSASTQTFVVTSDCDFEIENHYDWFRVVRASPPGRNPQTYNVSVDANTSNSRRFGLFDLSASLASIEPLHRTDVTQEAPANATDRIRIWIKAFIPNRHPSNPAHVLPVPGSPYKWMIPGPVGNTECYLTNNRSFAVYGSREAKVTTEFELVVNTRESKIESVEGRANHQPGPSQRVNCLTGQNIGEPRVAILRKKALGGPHVADGNTQVIIDVSAVNPFAPQIVSPSIDYSVSLTYNLASKTIRYRATVGRYPAYEAYAQLEGENVQTLFTLDPVGDSPWALYEFGTGIGERSFQGEVKVRP